MRLSFVTLFPDSLRAGFERGVILKAIERGLLVTSYVDPRDFAYDRHRKADDRPFSGEPGMLLKAEPVALAIESLGPARRLAPDPTGPVFDQPMARTLSAETHLVFVCGHYEGIDDRALTALDVSPVSLGEFVLSGGDLAAATMADAIARLIPGVLGDEASLSADSFGETKYAAPNFTRPAVWRGLPVPEPLLSGDPKKIDAWRKSESDRIAAVRPDPAREALRAELLARFAHDRWARERWAPVLPLLGDDGAAVDRHMRGCLRGWITRFDREIADDWDALHDAWDDLLRTGDLHATSEFRFRDRRRIDLSLADVARQVVGHGTYHRGDLRRLAVSAGIDFPDTDWIHYLGRTDVA